MRNLLFASAAASLLIAGQALAEDAKAPAAAAAAAPAEQAPAAGVTVNDEELRRFAKVAVETRRIMGEHQPKIAAATEAAAKAKAEEAMGGELQVAVTDGGFTIKRYNEIATAMQSDKSLLTRMQQLAAGGAPATSSNQ